MKQFIGGVLFGAVIGGSVIVAAQQPGAPPTTFTDVGLRFVIAGGRVGQFNSEGDILPSGTHKAGESLPITMTPTGEVVCSNFITEKLIRDIADHIGALPK